MQNRVKNLENIAKDLRKNIITMIYKAQSGHPGGSLSASDIMAALYFDILEIDPKDPKKLNRDRFVLSKGHCCPVLYSSLGLKGFFDTKHLATLRKKGSILQGHPDMNKVSGIDMTTGSLGQGLSAACGMARGYQLDGIDNYVYCLMGDGEQNEGQIWEAAMCASKYKLNNLVGIVDVNGLQNDGFTKDIMPNGELKDKWLAFGWHVIEIDGHDMSEIIAAFDSIKVLYIKKPICILAKTIKGKYVSFMENVEKWHGTVPNDEEYKIAISDIEGGTC